MLSSRNQIRLVCLSVVLVASACGGNENDTDTISSAIYQGINISQTELDNSGLVAIYHPKDPGFPNWYPRPCSGVIVSSNGGLTTILTARHCVTTDNIAYGNTLVDPSRLRVVRTLNPGPANPNPPAGITPYLVMDKGGAKNDVAVIFASVDWTPIGDKRIGLYVGDPHTLVGTQFTAYGYGINVADGSCGVDNTTAGAGVARSGAAFTVTSGINFLDGQPASYNHNATSTGGQALYCGDSGGPDELTALTNAGRTILGVHSNGVSTTVDVDSTAFDVYLQYAVGGLYLTPTSQRSSDVMVGVDRDTNVLKMVGRTNPDQVTFTYDVPSKLLLIGGGWACASAANGSPAQAVSCTGDASQQWEVRTNGQLSNPGTGKCLTAGSSSLALGPCITRDFSGHLVIPATTTWLFHAQP